MPPCIREDGWSAFVTSAGSVPPTICRVPKSEIVSRYSLDVSYRLPIRRVGLCAWTGRHRSRHLPFADIGRHPSCQWSFVGRSPFSFPVRVGGAVSALGRADFALSVLLSPACSWCRYGLRLRRLPEGLRSVRWRRRRRRQSLPAGCRRICRRLP